MDHLISHVYVNLVFMKLFNFNVQFVLLNVLHVILLQFVLLVITLCLGTLNQQADIVNVNMVMHHQMVVFVFLAYKDVQVANQMEVVVHVYLDIFG